jgi:hypothetical protein
MAGTTRLELATSAVTVLRSQKQTATMNDPGRHKKAMFMRVRRGFCPTYISTTDTERAAATWAAMVGLRHKVRHKNWAVLSPNQASSCPAWDRTIAGTPGWYEHRICKGPDDGVNLHVFSLGCPEIERMVRFRNCLRVSKDDRELYARTKQALAKREWKYTQNHADAKSAVIEHIMSRAGRAAAT